MHQKRTVGKCGNGRLTRILLPALTLMRRGDLMTRRGFLNDMDCPCLAVIVGGTDNGMRDSRFVPALTEDQPSADLGIIFWGFEDMNDRVGDFDPSVVDAVIAIIVDDSKSSALSCRMLPSAAVLARISGDITTA